MNSQDGKMLVGAPWHAYWNSGDKGRCATGEVAKAPNDSSTSHLQTAEGAHWLVFLPWRIGFLVVLLCSLFFKLPR